MAKRPYIFRSFEGGWSTDAKMGLKNSFLYSQAVDFRKSPSQLTVLPGLARTDSGVVKDLVQNEVMIGTGATYAVGSAGWLYKASTADVWSAETQLSQVGTFGMDYRRDTNALYVTGTKSVSLVNKVDTAPVYLPAYYADSFSTYNNTANAGFNVNSYQIDSTLTTAIGTTISENDTSKRFFQSDIEPLNKISIYIHDKGTGDWTITLHDGLNNVLGSSTVANANLNSLAWNDFAFTSAPNSQVRIYVAPNARTYHIHVTSTVADGTVASSATNDLMTCDLKVYADRMVVTQNGMHPMARFLQYEIIGNGNYLSVWEPLTDPPTNAEWLRHKLVFPMEYEVCGIATFNEYVAIACEKVSTNASSIPQEGIIFWWDGLSSTYNYLTKVPEGSPYAIHEYKNQVYYYAGGDWWVISSPAAQPVKIRKMPGSDTEYSGTSAPIVINPYAATVRRGIHLMAYPSTSTNTGIDFGVYSYGAVDKNFPESFGYSYALSTDSKRYTADNHLSIGMVRNFGDTLHVSWRDDTNGGYGVDVVNNSSNPAANATWESLILDNGYPAKQKKAIYLQGTFLTLPSDCTFKLKYKLDRATDWSYSPEFTAANLTTFNLEGNYVRWDIDNPNYYYEIQVGIDIVSGTTTPTFTSLTLVIDDASNEELS